MRQLLTVYGEASPTASGQTGVFTLYAPDVVYGTFSAIRIPKGCKVKIWAKRLSGTTSFRLLIQYTSDIRPSQPSWTTIDAEYLASPGSLELEKRRPAVVFANTGNEGIQVAYSDTGGAGKISVVLEIEITDEEDPLTPSH